MYLLLLLLIGLVIFLLCRKKTSEPAQPIQPTQPPVDIEAQLQQKNNELITKYELELAQRKNELNTNFEVFRSTISEKYSNYEAEEKQRVIKSLNDYRQQVKQTEEAERRNYDTLRARAVEVYEEGLKSFQSDAEQYKIKLGAQLYDLQELLNEYEAKRAALNEEILRKREIEEQADFYRIVLTNEDKNDIALLNSIRPQLRKATSFDKMIYDIYIAKPANEMIKRVLKGEAPSGIYKITRNKTGEVYIGKSTDVKSRWQQHTKSAFHCGTISHSTLHTTMERDGVDNFTWELLEEVPKDKLSEREKFWIEFYDSKKYGLNEKAGG